MISIKIFLDCVFRFHQYFLLIGFSLGYIIFLNFNDPYFQRATEPAPNERVFGPEPESGTSNLNDSVVVVGLRILKYFVLTLRVLQNFHKFFFHGILICSYLTLKQVCGRFREKMWKTGVSFETVS